MAKTGSKWAVSGFLSRLRRDVRGNTLAIMAAAMLPLCGFAGSAIDMARLYVVKVRLQQACDAGVLAGRKFLPSGSVAGFPLTGDDLTQANTYFTNNITTSWGGSGWYTGTPSFSPYTVADSNLVTQVAGTASAIVPMTLMAMFGQSSRTLTVTCQARFDTPDTDVMFVLDNTGSMGCAVTDSDSTCSTYVGNNTTSYTKADGTTGYYVKEKTSSGANVSRIDSLRTAVNTFYTTVQGSIDSTTHVRYGFVPYTSTVNVGPLVYAVNSSYFVARGSYQSRRAIADYIKSTDSYTAISGISSSSACAALATVRTPATTTDVDGNTVYSYPNSGTAARKEPYWYSSNSANGFVKNTCYWQNETVVPTWKYMSGVKYDTGTYLTGATMTDPSKVDGSTTVWNGCIEEQTTANSSPTAAFDINNLPADMNPDLIPSADTNRWTPMWPDVEFARDDPSSNSTGGTVTVNDNGSNSSNNTIAAMPDLNASAKLKSGYMTCPTAAKLLFLPDTVTGGAQISAYVAGLKAIGGTYHDTGMIWGARLLSPTGIFSSNNAYPAGRAAPKKVIVFVTDGAMAPNSSIYGMYGEENMDRRVTGTYYGSADPSNYTSYSNSNSTNQDWHTQRFLAECARAKSSPLNADIWVVAVGSSLPSSMTTCASQPSQALWAQTQQQLTDAFKAIAQQVAMLRVSQ